jgi:hypothetical protein
LQEKQGTHNKKQKRTRRVQKTLQTKTNVQQAPLFCNFLLEDFQSFFDTIFCFMLFKRGSKQVTYGIKMTSGIRKNPEI